MSEEANQFNSTRQPSLEPAGVPFHSHVQLLQLFLVNRTAIVDLIGVLLNCQKRPLEYQQDFELLARLFSDCFHICVAHEYTVLPNYLEPAHWASGFKPRATPGNALVDPVEQMLRAFHMWRQTNWPGQKGRAHFAHTLFNLYIVRSLALLCMRLWDEGSDAVPERLALTQALLDSLWESSPADQPRLVRDVRWLFPVAMSPTTDTLDGYFDVAQRIADTFAASDRVHTQMAWVQTGAGHLRSQLYHLAVRKLRDSSGADGAAPEERLDLDENGLVLVTRMSNALDIALLVQGLVTLLEAYECCLSEVSADARGARSAVEDGALDAEADVQRQSLATRDERKRLELACAICQGISPDPELFVTRLDLLGPYSMIEHLFITTDAAGQAVYTAMGQRHVALLAQYAALLDRVAQPLYADWQRCKPTGGNYSPFGVLYGFASNLLELLAFKTLQRDAAIQFSIEDAFSNGDAARIAWVNAWRKLPHIKAEIVRQFEYPAHFVDAIAARIEMALQQRATAADANLHAGRLFVSVDGDQHGTAQLARVARLPLQYIVSSDPQLVAAGKAVAKDQQDLLHCRVEGEFLVSYQTAGGWLALTKDLLTGTVGAGTDAHINGLPRTAAAVLSLMCPGLVVLNPV